MRILIKYEDTHPAVQGLETNKKIELIERMNTVESKDHNKWFKENYNDFFHTTLNLKRVLLGQQNRGRYVPISPMILL